MSGTIGFVAILLVALSSVAPLVAASCESLASLALPNTTITLAQPVAPGDFMPPAASARDLGAPVDWKQAPAFCRVAATIRPVPDSEIKMELWLPVSAPVSTWNNEFEADGNGGWTGSINYRYLGAALLRGFAAGMTDAGHEGGSASFALGHPQKVIDFGYRALKETTDAARAIVRAHTGRAPARSYFTGCSDGGREALMEAQRYPADFDGIVAGAPANDWTHLFVGAVWDLQALAETPGSYVRPAKLRALEEAALHACGDEDGVIEDPLSCQFDPAVLRCKGAEDDRCLTDAQIKAVRAI